MRIYPHKQFADAKEERRQGERGFTMVEIALAIGVIGFALVAVIGILPAGMNVQKDNREDTTISQDAPFFMDAIRNGGSFTNSFINHGLDFLTNYVEAIMLFGITNGVAGTQPFAYYTNFESGAEIVGLLSTPQGLNVNPSNYIVTRAIVRSLEGSAVQQNGANLATAFRYRMDLQIVPFVNVAPDSTNFLLYSSLYGADSPQCLTRSNRWLELDTTFLTNGSAYLQAAAGPLTYNCFDVRMHFSWPVLPGPNNTQVVGPGRQNYRTTVASALVRGAFLPAPIDAQLWFFQPQFYANTSTL